MYAPQHRPGLEIELLMEEELVLVTTDLTTYRANDPQIRSRRMGFGLFSSSRVSFPDTVPSLVANLGPLGSQLYSLEGGSGYFRMHAVQSYLEAGKLHLVPGAPQFSFPVYALHSINADTATLDAALTVLRAVANVEVEVIDKTLK